jgi:hypothetical protein
MTQRAAQVGSKSTYLTNPAPCGLAEALKSTGNISVRCKLRSCKLQHYASLAWPEYVK